MPRVCIVLLRDKIMEDQKKVYISREGLERLKAELAELEGTKLKENAKRIAEAKDLGDLSENAEYHEAKREQSFLAGKAKDIRHKIKYAEIIEKCQKKDEVTVGCTVEVDDGGETDTYRIVGSDEADPANGSISADSPIGSALLGGKIGDTVSVATPGGEIEYKIENIK